MTPLVGPVYIAHPYSAPTPELRSRNVELAASLSSAVNRAGCATISPLQESRGREEALTEEQWIQHGLVLLRACGAVVLPWYWQDSIGCRAEVQAANWSAIPWFVAVRNAPGWVLENDFAQWVAAMTREVRP